MINLNDLAKAYKCSKQEKDFNKLIAAYRPILMANVSSIIKKCNGRKYMSDDICSVVEYKFFVNIPEYYNPELGDFTSWAYKVAARETVKFIKDNRTPTIDLSDNMDIETEVAEDYVFIKDAVNQLDSDLRDSINAVFIDEKGYVGASKYLHVPVSTVWQRCTKGINMLKIILQ